MKIEFYEEFPSKKSFEKLKLIKFKTKLFVAAKSLSEFRRYEKLAKSYKKDLEVAYWPVVRRSYWVSGFSNTNDLIELFRELDSIKNPVLIDLELPKKNNWDLYLRNIFRLKKNKRLITDFLERNKGRVTTAEYIRSPLGKFEKWIGLDFQVNTEKSLMFYTSRKKENDISREQEMVRKISKKCGQLSLSLGLTMSGVSNKPGFLTKETLSRDMNFAKLLGVDKVIIFRLEGVKNWHVDIFKEFL